MICRRCESLCCVKCLCCRVWSRFVGGVKVCVVWSVCLCWWVWSRFVGGEKVCVVWSVCLCCWVGSRFVGGEKVCVVWGRLLTYLCWIMTAGEKCVCCVEQVVNLAVLNHDGWRVTPGVCCAAFLINILPQMSYIGIFMNILSLRFCDFLSQPASPNQSLKSVIFSLFFQTLWSFPCSARHSYLLLVLPDYRIINTLENLLLFFFLFFFLRLYHKFMACPRMICDISLICWQYQFSSVPWLGVGGVGVGEGGAWHDPAEILFQSFLLETIVSSSGMGRDVHSLMLSIQHFLCWLWHFHVSSVVGNIEANCQKAPF